MLHSHVPYHTDTIIKKHAKIKTQEDFLEKYLPLTLLQAFEKVYSTFACERELETEHN